MGCVHVWGPGWGWEGVLKKKKKKKKKHCHVTYHWSIWPRCRAHLFYPQVRGFEPRLLPFSPFFSLECATRHCTFLKSSPTCSNTRKLCERRRQHPCAAPTRASLQTQRVHLCYLWRGAAEVSYLQLLRQWRFEINPGIRTAGLCKKACRSATALECTLPNCLR